MVKLLGPMLCLNSCWLYTGIQTVLSMHACMYAKSLQLCPTQCSAMDCRPPGSSAYGIFQARILEYVATPSSWGCSQPRGLNPYFLHLLHSVQFPIIAFLTLISLSLRCKPLCPSQPITAPSLYHNCPHLVVGHSYPHPVLLCGMEWLGPVFTQLDLEHMPRWSWETWQPIEQTSLHLAFQAS